MIVYSSYSEYILSYYKIILNHLNAMHAVHASGQGDCRVELCNIVACALIPLPCRLYIYMGESNMAVEYVEGLRVFIDLKPVHAVAGMGTHT